MAAVKGMNVRENDRTHQKCQKSNPLNLGISEQVLSADVRSFRVKGHVGSTVVNEFTFLGTIVYVTWSTASFIGWDYLGFDEKSYNSREF